MAQKNLPILNRVGIYQNWNNMWDSALNYNLFFKTTTFIEKLLTKFLEFRNTLHPYLINKCFLANSLNFTFNTIKNPNYFLISRDLRRLKKKRKLYIYVGKVVFLKLQNWLIVVVYTFKPTKIKKINKRKPVLITQPLYKPYLNKYLNIRLVQNNLNSISFF